MSVDEEFIGIKDVYTLQCLATELKRNNINEILKSDYDLLCKDYKKATKKIEKQETKIKNQEEKINKVIDYIEHKAKIKEYFMVNGKEYNELLDILKGNDTNGL